MSHRHNFPSTILALFNRHRAYIFVCKWCMWCVPCVFTLPSMFDEPLHHLQRQRENDGGVLLGGDGVEGLKVTQLQGWRRLRDHQGGLLQRPRCIHLSLRCDHLEKKNGRGKRWMNMIEGEGSLNEGPQCDYMEKKTLLSFSSITPTCLVIN